MVPDDPLGRSGPRLEEFLRKEVFLRYIFPFPDCLVFTNLFVVLCFKCKCTLSLNIINGLLF